MKMCVLSFNGIVQKKDVPNPTPGLFNIEPNGNPPIMTPHINTFTQNGKWECQPHCNIFHHRAFDLHKFSHTFSAFGDSQDNDAIA